jgi:hypothetical protein
MRGSYDWSADVAKLKGPVMLVYGDSDMFKPEHIVKFYQLLGGGLKDAGWQREHMSKNRLAIIPDREPGRGRSTRSSAKPGGEDVPPVAALVLAGVRRRTHHVDAVAADRRVIERGSGDRRRYR